MSAAYAVGLPLPLLMRLSNHTSQEVVLRHYVDTQCRRTPSARLFFERFLTSGASPTQAAP
ncbi:unnamed protein product [Chondrus crispus]|uniref:Uncharacterized protein n=1 Tax=Chondrus crispus TaxID=2769 RepID=R7QUL5_CHOCR|nr:unnamed protein product [Chondrus crispus]CDF41176.1 unnamed protein product [Chondrus crispus]|eukprot:XP_005711470.1 unnamed protein product [Chondrus crispus]